MVTWPTCQVLSMIRTQTVADALQLFAYEGRQVGLEHTVILGAGERLPLQQAGEMALAVHQ